jgi:hypothetical protein
MGIKRDWLTWAVVGGLVAVFIGQRVLFPTLVPRLLLTGTGTLIVFGGAAWRLRAWAASDGDERRVEMVFALAYLGCALSLIGFGFSSASGVRLLGLDFDGVVGEERFRRLFLVGSSILLMISLLPAFAAQWAIQWSGGQQEGRSRVELLRATDMATSALSVALAAGFLSLGAYVTHHRDRTFDASYFKTSSAGSAVAEIVGGFEEPLRVLLFFPEVHAVKDEVSRYFGQLASATDNVLVEEYDRLAQPLVAQEYDVSEDGSVLLIRGGQITRFGLPLELDAARARLRLLDGEVQSYLLRLARDRRFVYMTVGHGELNDALGRGGAGAGDAEEAALPFLEDILGALSYDARQLGLRTGLADRIPDDAVALFILGPSRPFLPEELNSVQEYLDRGGSLLLALEPDSDFTLDGLRDRLGLDFVPVLLVDEDAHMRQRGGLSDRQLIVSNLFSSHASVTTAGRRGVGTGITLPGAGHLVRAEDVEGPRVRFTIGALNSTFADLNGNFQFDPATETKAVYDVAAAVERGAAGTEGMRALVYADADMFSDVALNSVVANRAVAADGIRWLGREEEFSGEVVSEADLPIVHTRAEDVVWFYLIILGAPMLVGLGRWGAVILAERRRAA